MRSWALLLSFVIGVGVMGACTPPGPTQPSSFTVTQNQYTYVIVAPSPQPSAPPNCEAGSVAIQSSLGNTFNTNQESTLSASVLGKDGQSIPAECGAITVEFGLEDAPAPKATCQILGGEAPVLRCSTAGNAKVRAKAGGAEAFASFIIKSN